MLSKIVFAKIKKISTQKNSILVLKGIPLKIVDANAVENLETAASNPIQYLFQNIVAGGRKFLTYEEFLLLKNILVAQFSQIMILNNNLYIGQYPIENKFSSDTLNNLLEHFTEPEIGQGKEFDFGNFAKIFTGLKRHNNILIGAYNDDGISEQFQVLNLFDANNKAVVFEETFAQDFLSVEEESDFVYLVQKILFEALPEVFIHIQNYIGDRQELNARLKILQEVFSARIKLASYYKSQPEFQSTPEYLTLLKNVWSYESFRELTVYDLANLDVVHGIKPTLQISQEKIISDIIAQVENCRQKKPSRDIFVTASTGAGKSLMFQLPAIYFAKKYKLFTIVISPLIGLMNDQVKNLQKVYPCVETFHSDTAPIIKRNITQKIIDGDVNILYISPETLLARSDLDQLIGDRAVGLVVIDEAHIVTTWGKQFRPDYWYLGDHIRKLRQMQRQKFGHSFIIATFTATMTYHGFEDMYNETIESLQMLNPSVYLGYVKRNDIDIAINSAPFSSGQTALYEIAKFKDIEAAVDRANIFRKKTLIYFPEVRLIEKAFMTLENHGKTSGVAVYHGQLDKDMKNASQCDFTSGKKMVMLATKAFGMGIDIDNIEIVMHFAPTGNVCDYVQEIGRAARKNNLRGMACYHYDKRDFKYINRLHGLSAIKKSQLLAVIEKICAIYNQSRKSNLLLDAENFTYIFSRYGDENSSVNKVKTALLIIQRGFEFKIGFTPIIVRPIPLFAYGYFEISPLTQDKLQRDYSDCFKVINRDLNICSVNLKKIWERGYDDKSFQQFKYLLYTGNKNLNFDYPMHPAFRVLIHFKANYKKIYSERFSTFKEIITQNIAENKYISVDEIVKILRDKLNLLDYKVENICEVLIASMIEYRRSFSRSTNAIFAEEYKGAKTRYRFNAAVNRYFEWVDKIFQEIIKNTTNGELYLTNIFGNTAKEFSSVLGILEVLEALSFEMKGGEGTQIYIHINQIENLQHILNDRSGYRNPILEKVADRHKLAVEMLNYIYESNFDSADIWNLLEDYFLGKIPTDVKFAYNEKNPYTYL